MSNYLAASALLEARLNVQMPGFPPANIRPAPSLDWAIRNQLAPSVNVIFFDDVPIETVTGSSRSAHSQASDQFWLLLVTGSSVEGVGNSAIDESGSLAGDVIAALLGCELSSQHGPLHRRKCPYRKTDRDGYSHVPLLFSTRIVLTGAR